MSDAYVEQARYQGAFNLTGEPSLTFPRRQDRTGHADRHTGRRPENGRRGAATCGPRVPASNGLAS